MIGKLLGGRYEIIEQIGGGGMALVYKAKCTLLNRFVAIKVLRDEFVEDDEFVEKFRRESQAAASLSHPNIVNIYDVGTDEEDKIIHYIVMEYINGPTLKEVIKSKGKLSAKETVDYSTQIANALKAAHNNNIIHRDIKPQNIMIDENNRIKVMDFGIARAATSSTITTTSEALGSVHYFSPEQARGGYTDEKSDIYSLGIVMYEMITGKLPYEGESPITVALKHVQETITPPSEIDPSVAGDVEAVILRAVEKRQMDRYLNMDEMLIDLDKLMRKYNVLSISNETMEKKDISSHTRVIPVVKPVDAVASSETKEQKKEEKLKKKKKKENFKVALAGVLLAFLLTFSVFFGKDIIGNVFAKDEVEMPDLVGMLEEDAIDLLEEKGLKFKILDRIEDADVEPGIVLKQDISEGTKLKPGFPVQLTISAGSELVSVPLLTGKSIYEAEMLLRRSGLSVGEREDINSDSYDQDIVIEQSLMVGEEVKKGSRIDLVVSKGSGKEVIKMPNLTGMNIELAKQEILNRGLSIGNNIEEVESDYDKGIVIWQNYKEGTELDKSTAINLQVSKGRTEEEKIEDEEAKPEDKKPEEKPNEREKVFTINASSEGTEIRIDRTYNGVTENIYNETVVGEKSVKVSGPEGSIFDIYYDGSHEGSFSN